MNKIEKLYGILSEKYNFGDYETFASAMDDEEKRRKVYDIASESYNLGDYESFSASLGYTPQAAPSAPSASEIAEEMEPMGVEGEKKRYRAGKSPLSEERINQRDILKNQLNQEIARVDEEFGNRTLTAQQEYNDRTNKQSFWRSLGENMSGGGGIAGMPRYARTGNGLLADEQWKELYAEKKILERAERTVEEAEHNREGGFMERSFMGGAARAVGQTISDQMYGSMGVGSMIEAAESFDAISDYDRTGVVSPLLESKALEMAINEEFGEDVGRGYKAGRTTAESLPFMAEMLISPYTGVGKKATSEATKRAIEKYGKDYIRDHAKRYVAQKALMRVGYDVGAAAVMAGSTGQARIASDALDRMGGEVAHAYDMEGNSAFLGHTEGDSFVKALGKAYAGTTIENYSELFGEYFGPLFDVVGSAARKGLSKIGLEGVYKFIDNVNSSDLARFIDDFEKNTHWNGMFSEYAEEVVGNIMNALVVHDMTLDTAEDTGVFNLDVNIDTFLGVSLMGGFMSGAKTLGYRTPVYQARKRISTADKNARSLFKDDVDTWNDMRDLFDPSRSESITDEERKRVLGNILRSGAYTPEQKMALLTYVGAVGEYRGMLQIKDKQREEDNSYNEVNEAYDKGYEAQLPELYNFRKAVVEAKKRLSDYATSNGRLDAMNDAIARICATPEDRDTILDEFNEQEQSLIMDVINSEMTMKGVYVGVSDRIDDNVDEFAYSLEPFVVTDAQGNRTITIANLNQGTSSTPVYVIQNDGTNAIIMHEDGKSEMVLSKELSNVNTQSADELISTFRQQAGVAMEAETQNAVNYREGVQEPVVGMQLHQDGETLMVTSVVGDEVQVVPAKLNPKNGQVEPTRATPRTISVEDAKQMQNDHIEAEEAKKNFKQGADVTFYIDGEAVGAHINRGEDADGKYTVELDRDVDGLYRVGRYTLDEMRELTTPPVSMQQIDNEADKVLAEEGENATMPTEEIEQSVSEEVEESAPITLEETVAELLGQGLEEDEVNDFVAYNTKVAMDAAKKVMKKKPTMEQAKGNIATYKAMKAAWEEELAVAQEEVQYWADVAAEVGRQLSVQLPEQVAMPTRSAQPIVERTERVVPPMPLVQKGEGDRLERRLKDASVATMIDAIGEPQSLEEYVLVALAGKGHQLRWSDKENGTKGFGSHTGLSRSAEEKRKRNEMLSENGLTPEEFAHQLVENMDMNFGEVDAMDVTDMVIDYVASFSSRRDMLRSIIKHRADVMRAAEADAQAMADADYMERYHATEEELNEYNDYLAESAEEIYGEDAEYEERLITFAEEYENYENQGTDAGVRSSADQGEGAVSGRERGSSVGSTERLDEQGVLREADRVAEGEDQGAGDVVSAESDVAAWEAVTKQRIEELDYEIADLEDGISVLEEDRDAAQFGGEYEAIVDAIAEMEERLRDAIAEREGLAALAEEELINEAGYEESAKEDKNIFQKGITRAKGALFGDQVLDMAISATRKLEETLDRYGRVKEPSQEIADVIRRVNKERTILARTPMEKELLAQLRRLTKDEVDYVLRQFKDARSTEGISKEEKNQLDAAILLITRYKGRKSIEAEAVAKELTGAKLGEELPLSKVDELFERYNADEELSELYGRVRATAEEIGLVMRFDNGIPDEHSGIYRFSENLVAWNSHLLYANAMTDQQKANIIVHEMVHAISKYAILSYQDMQMGRTDVKLPPRLKAAAKSLINIYEKVVKNNPALMDQIYDEDTKSMVSVPMYGTKNVDEMISELSNPEFREALAKVEYQGRTILQRILDAIKRFFHIPTDVYDNTALFYANEALDRLIEDFDKEAYLSQQEYERMLQSAERLEESVGEVDVEKGDVHAVAHVLKGGEREQAIKDLMEVTGRSRKTVVKWLKAEESLASVILNEDNIGLLDLEADESLPSVWKNSDYPQGTVEFSNICRKRLPFTHIYQRLQKEFPNTVFDANTLNTIRETMKEMGDDVACGLCFVEDRRQLLGEIGQSFIEAVSGKDVKLNNKQVEIIARLKESGDTYVPSLFDILTLDGMKALRKSHPEVARAFVDYNNARGMQSGRLFMAYSAYNREILKYSKDKVKRINDNGGLRIFSFSDFEAHHLIDLVQVLTDCAAKGIKVQGYTKVPEFAKAVKDTGAKINRSLIAKGKGYVDADYVPQKGEAVSPNVIDGKRLLFDTVEGINVNDPNFFDASESNSVGNILVVINEEHARLAMLDPFVDYIIGFHSGQSKQNLQGKGVDDWHNYKNEQLDKVESVDKDGNVKLNNAPDHGINIYTDVLNAAEAEGKPIKTKREFVERFLQECEKRGFVPRFANYLDKKDGRYVYTEGYHKFLIDFKLFDERGRILPQNAVVPVFDNDFNKQILEDYVKGEKEKMPNEEVYDAVKKAIGLDEPTELFREDRNSELKEKYTNEQIFEAAKQKFGVTDDIRAAGYILPDGSMLDFSGRSFVDNKDSFKGGTRAEDHRAISQIEFDENDNATGLETNITDFIERGAIRIHVDSYGRVGMINLDVAPTKEQKAKLRQLIAMHKGFVDVDFGNGWDTDHHAEYDNASATRVLGDIDRYYSEGIRPEGNAKYREGEGEISDKEVSYQNDPIGKWMGKPRYTGKKAAEFAKRERKRMRQAVAEVSEALGLEVTMLDSTEGLSERKAKAKGWYNTETGEISVVIPNHVSAWDAVQSVLHEGVAHYGLRKLFGDKLDVVLDNIYNNVAPELKAKIDAIANKSKVSTRVATEEYLASLAETTNFEQAVKQGWWAKIKQFFVDMFNSLTREGVNVGEITDNELRYILWSSYQKMTQKVETPMSVIEDAAMQQKLKVGRFAEMKSATPMAADEGGDLFRFIGEKGAENLDRYEEATTRLDNLKVAKEMEASDKDAKTIKMATGWERGADGLWRYETEDEVNFDFNAEGETLGDYLDASELFEAYPKLRETRFEWTDNPAMKGQYDSVHNIIRLNGKFSEEEMKRTLVHEIQHAIQGIEGFATGTNPVDAERYLKKDLPEEHEKAYEIVNRYDFTLEEARQWIKNPSAALIYEDKPLKALIADVDAGKVNWDDIPKWSIGGYRAYTRAQGEVEARNAASRLGMTLEERRASLASETEDVAREDQIFLRNAVESAMAAEGVYNYGKYTLSDIDSGKGGNFYQDSNGNINLVEIEQEIMDEIGLPHVPFRINESMAKHVQKQHPEMKAKSYEEIVSFIVWTMKNFDHVRKGSTNDTYIFSVENNRKIGRRAITIIIPSNNEEFLGVKTSGYESVERLQKRPLLWEKGANLTSTADTASANVTSKSAEQGGGLNSSASNQNNSLSSDKVSDNSSSVQEENVKSRRRTAEIVDEGPFSTEEKTKAIVDEAAKLGVKVRVANDASELHPQVQEDIAKGRPVKGYYNTRTGEVVIYAPYATSTNDVKRTILHEIVGHKGLRQLLGEDGFNKMMVQMYYMLPEKTRQSLNPRMERNGWSIAVGMDEYLSEQAEMDVTPSWWGRINAVLRAFLRELGFDVELNDADVKYLLWRSRKKLEGDDAFDMVVNAIMKNAANKKATEDEMRAEEDVRERAAREEERAMSDAITDYYEKRTATTNADSFKGGVRYMFSHLGDGGARALLNDLSESQLEDIRSVRVLEEAIERAEGRKLQEHEMVHKSLNAKESVSAREMDKSQIRFFQPLTEVLGEILGKKINGRKIEIDDVERYLICKHSKENNEFLMKRAHAENKRKRINERAKELMKGSMTEEEAIAQATSEYRLHQSDFRDDYSGLTELFPDNVVREWKIDDRVRELESEGMGANEALQKAVEEFEDYKPTLEDREQMAEEEVNRFEAALEGLHHDLWKIINGINQDTIDRLFNSGLISRSLYNDLKKRHKFYVPLSGWKNDAAADIYDYATYSSDVAPIQTVIKKAYGTKYQARNILGSIFAMNTSAIIEGNQNLVKQKLYNLALNHKTGVLQVVDMWEVKEGEGENAEWRPAPQPDLRPTMSDAEMQEVLTDYQNKLAQMEKDGKARKAVNSLADNFGKHTTDREANRHHVELLVDGRKVVLWVNGNPKLAQAINGDLTKNAELLFFTNAVRSANRFLAQVQTSLNPEFMISNFERDILSASRYNLIMHGAKHQALFLKHLAQLMPIIAETNADMRGNAWGSAGIFNLFALDRNTNNPNRKPHDEVLDMNNRTHREFVNFLNHGGKTGYVERKQAEDLQTRVSKLSKREQSIIRKMSAEVAGWAVDTIERMNEGIENATRFAAYLAARDMGKSITEAVFEAKEVSVNFNMHGSGAWGNATYRLLYNYFNVGLQALRREKNMFRESPKGYIAQGAFMMALGAVSTILLGANFDDDDEDEYMGLSEFNRYNYINIKSKDGFYHYSLPQDLRAFYAIGCISTEWAQGKIDGSRAMRAYATQVNNYTPLSFVSTTIDREPDNNPLKQFGLSLVPSAVVPAAEIAVNEDFLGRRINNQNQWNTYEPEWQRAGYRTPEAVINASKVLSEIGGGTEHKRGVWFTEINPSNAWHVIDSYGGGFLDFAQKCYNLAEKELTGEEHELRDYPMVSKFYVESGQDYSKQRVVNDRYRMYREDYETIDNELRGYLRDENNQLDRLAVRANEEGMSKEEIAKERAAIEKVYNDNKERIETSPNYWIYKAFEENERYYNRLDRDLDDARKAGSDAKVKELSGQMYDMRKGLIDRLDAERSRTIDKVRKWLGN